MKHNFKVAIFDLDGTLTNSRKELTPATRDTLIELQRSGVRVVLASGRPTYGIVPLARELQLERWGGYILAFNGGVIVECESGREIFSQKLSRALIKPLYDKAIEEGCVMLSYRDEKILTESPEDQYVLYEAMLNKMIPHGVESFVESFDCDVAKCLAVGESECAERLVERLVDLYGDVMSIYRSEPFFVELVPLGVDKAKSLRRLAREIGVVSSEMIAFGDGYNDLSMIEFAGCGVAMANAQEEVRAAADVVALGNDEDGVAEYVRRCLL